MDHTEKSVLLDDSNNSDNLWDNYNTSRPTSPTIQSSIHHNSTSSTNPSTTSNHPSISEIPTTQPYTSTNTVETEDEVDKMVVDEGEEGQHNTTSDDNNTSQFIDSPTTTLYYSRFWILFIFSMMALFQDLQWMTWGPIDDSVDAAFDGWGSSTVAMMANWGTIMFVITIIPMCWLMTAKGLRVGVLTCAVLIAIGTLVRIIPFLTSSDTFFTVMCHICAICVGIPGTLVMAAPPLIAAVWFPPKERTSATAMAQVMNQLGSAVGYLEPLMVRSPTDGAKPEEIRSDIQTLLYIWAGFGCAIFLSILIYFPAKPPTPPSKSSHVQRLDFRDSVARMIRNKDMWIITLAYGINNGLPAAWTSVLNFSLKNLGLNQDEAMWIGLSSVIVSGVVTLAAGRLTDYVYGYLKPSLFFCIICNIICYYWFFLLSWGAITVTKWQIYASVIGGMSFSFACSPLFFELAVEICYPCSEVIVAGLLTGVNNLVGLTFLFIFFIPNIGFDWVTYLLLGGCSFVLIPLLFVNEDYSRSSIDRHYLQQSAYQPI